jgi:hypothetical protein
MSRLNIYEYAEEYGESVADLRREMAEDNGTAYIRRNV